MWNCTVKDAQTKFTLTHKSHIEKEKKKFKKNGNNELILQLCFDYDCKFVVVGLIAVWFDVVRLNGMCVAQFQLEIFSCDWKFARNTKLAPHEYIEGQWF